MEEKFDIIENKEDRHCLPLAERHVFLDVDFRNNGGHFLSYRQTSGGDYV